MGSPFFTWWPHHTKAAGQREIITLSEDLSDLQITPRRNVSDTFSVYGGRSRELLRPWLEVRIVLERFTDRDLFRKFTAMINHMERGGTVAFGLDSAKAWMVALTKDHAQGERVIHCGPILTTVYHSASSSVVVAVDDELVIESGPPLAKREYHTVNAVAVSGSGGASVRFDLSPSGSPTVKLRDDYPEGSRVRFSDFFPTLILPPEGVGSAMLTHDHRISYTLDLNLVYVIPFTDEQITVINKPGDSTPQATEDDSDK